MLPKFLKNSLRFINIINSSRYPVFMMLPNYHIKSVCYLEYYNLQRSWPFHDKRSHCRLVCLSAHARFRFGSSAKASWEYYCTFFLVTHNITVSVNSIYNNTCIYIFNIIIIFFFLKVLKTY